MIQISTLFTVVPILLAIEGVFSGSEIALLSADRVRLRALAEKGSRRDRAVLKLVEHPERVLSATLLMTSLCVIASSSLIALYVFSNGYRHAELVSILLTSPLIVLFGELLPKTFFQRRAEIFSRWFAPLITGVYWTFLPITWVMAGYTRRLTRLLNPIEEVISGPKVGKREELRSLLSSGRKESSLKATEKSLIKRIFEFKDSEAQHCLIPLVKVEAIEVTAVASEALERFKRHRHSRMPVFEGRIDNIIGLLELTDFTTLLDPSVPIRNLVSPARYVAETQALEDLIREMRNDDEEMVIVVDEYGGAVGILTFEDIVEEIVGEIRDEYETSSAPYREHGPDRWLIQARMLITEINEQLRLEVPEGDYETLGGFLLQQFGKIPESGDELIFDATDHLLKFTIRKANQRVIETVFLEKKPKTESSDQP